MMAACRYYTVIKGIHDSSSNSISSLIFFSRKGVVCLIVGCWSYFFIMIGVLLNFNQMGKDPNGYCGTKPFTSLPLFLFYIGGVISFGFSATLTTLIYCRKLNKFMSVQNTAH